MKGILDMFERRREEKRVKRNLVCSFCGKARREVRKLIAGPGAFICDECVELSLGIVREENITPPFSPDRVPTTAEVGTVLDREFEDWVSLKQRLSIVLRQHFQFLAADPGQPAAGPPPAHVLIRGPSADRIELARILMRCLGVPFAVVDATELLEGDEPPEVSRSIVCKLLQPAHYHVGRTERGIVWIEDFDQLCHLPGDVPGEVKGLQDGVQGAIAELMAGAVVTVPFAGGKQVAIDTGGITFMCAGVFFGLSKATAKGAGTATHRRGADEGAPNQGGEILRLTDGEAAALVGCGLSPDLVKRLSAILPLETRQPVRRRRCAAPPPGA